MEDIGIYIHIPFCASKCFYCDFYSESNKDESVFEQYIDAICKEIVQNADILSIRNITTIYIGGGTPSLIKPMYIKKILDVLNLFSNKSIETTIEANPESLNEEKLKEYFSIGINRLSIGLQSVNDSTLKKIGRCSSAEKFDGIIKLANKIGFKNISVDLIIGLPDENIQDFVNTIKYLLELKEYINHISAYSLEVHNGTKLDFLIKNKYISLPDEDVERKMKYELDRILKENGYIRYEISNYAKKGFESKHNLKYWNKEEYLGFGAAASSYISNTRYTNLANIQKYIDGINTNLPVVTEKEELDEIGNIKEYVILKLRLKQGINLTDFKSKFSRDIYDLYKNEIEKLIHDGLLIKEKDNIHLTYRGEDLANLVWQQFI